MRSVGFLGFDEREKGGNLRKSICGLYTGHANVGIAEQYFKTAIERGNGGSPPTNQVTFANQRFAVITIFSLELICLLALAS
jgi:hypothetical protein